MKAEENNTTLEEALQRASKPLARKIEYSVNLIRRAEKIALSYDNRGGVFPCVQWWQGQPSLVPHRKVGRCQVYGEYEFGIS